MQIAILGRQPKLSLAELESLFGAEKLTVINSYTALVDTDELLPQAQLGGTMKSAKFLTRLQKTDLSGAFVYLQKTIPDHLPQLPEGKLQLGVSCYGFDVKADWIVRKVLGLKKVIKNSGRSVRIIENKKPELESAQVLYNKLTSPLGWELLLIKEGDDVIVGQTSSVQNIDDYSKRDFDRPKRDSFVGMLPPKLAQIMINLAVGQLVDGKWQMENSKTNKQQQTVIDPFCGTGVVLQEALLMGHSVFGSDISQKMVEYTRVNLDWLLEKYKMNSNKYGVEVADATTHKWPLSDLQSSAQSLAVVCETYLGKPLVSLPTHRELDEIMSEANDIAKKFLNNIAPQLKQDTRLCLALPAWYLNNGEYHHLKVLDHLTDLGYNRLDLRHATKSELIYHRPDQIVARELTILEKI